MITAVCMAHKRYKGKCRPTSECSYCWAIYNNVRNNVRASLSQEAVIQDPDDNVSPPILASCIRDLSDALQRMESINGGQLKRKAIVVLLQDMTGIGRRDIELILARISDLEITYCTPRTKV